MKRDLPPTKRPLRTVPLRTLCFIPLRCFAHQRHHLRSAIRLCLLGVLGLGFMGGSFLAARWLFAHFLELEALAPRLIARTLEIVLLFFTGLLTFSSALAAFSSLFLSADLPMLMAAPVPMSKLYLSRLTSIWIQSSWMMIAFALPIMAAAGPALAAPPWFYLALCLFFLPMTFGASALGSFLAMLLARIFPAKRTREAFLVLALTLFLGSYIAIRLAEPEQFFNPEGFAKLIALLQKMPADALGQHPAGWLLNLLFSGLEGKTLPAAQNALKLLLFALGWTLAGMGLARWTWRESFSLALEGLGAPQKSKSKQRDKALASEKAIKPEKAIARRDLKIFFRSAGQWSQLLFVAALILVYLFNFKHLRTLKEAGILGPGGIFFVNLTLGTMVAAVLAARFLYPAVSLEGKAFYIMQTAPIDPALILKAKVRFGQLPLIACCMILSLGSNAIAKMPLLETLGSAILTLLCAYSLTGLSIGMGALDARFDEPNPAKIASGLGAVTFMLLSLLSMTLLSALSLPLFLAIRRFDQSGNLPEMRTILLDCFLFLSAIGISISIHHLPLKWGANALRRYQR